MSLRHYVTSKEESRLVDYIGQKKKKAVYIESLRHNHICKQESRLGYCM